MKLLHKPLITLNLNSFNPNLKYKGVSCRYAKCWPSDWSFYRILDSQCVTGQSTFLQTRSLTPKSSYILCFRRHRFFIASFSPENVIQSWFLNRSSIPNQKQNIAYSSRSLYLLTFFQPLWTIQKQYKIFNIMKQSCLQLLLNIFLARCMKSHKVALVSGHLDFGLIYTHIFCIFTVTESTDIKSPWALLFLISFFTTYLLACVLYLSILAFNLTTRRKTSAWDIKRKFVTC